MNNTLKIELVINQNKVSFHNLTTFRIGLKITNLGNVTQTFDVSKTKLLVNNKESIAWDLSVQNGTIINLSIQPKKSHTVQWALGVALFKSAGMYLIKLKHNTFIQEYKVIVTN